MLLTKSPNSYGKNCSAPRALQVEKYSALTKFCSAPGTRAIGFFTAWLTAVVAAVPVRRGVRCTRYVAT